MKKKVVRRELQSAGNLKEIWHGYKLFNPHHTPEINQ